MRKTPILKSLVLLTGVVGMYVGFRLSGMSNLQPYKLLNIMGLLYNLLAVFVLSEVLVSSASWKKFCVEWTAPILLWSYLALPTGAIVGAILEWLLRHGPSAHTVGFFAFGNMCYMSYVGTALEHTVVLPRFFRKDIESRWRYLGFILLGSGMFLQVVSAVLGL
jgi:hypothetical protein